MSTSHTSTHLRSLTDALQHTWHTEIPLSKAMALTIRDFDGDTLVTQADLGPNVNVHGTAFAGSLYALQALTGWGMVNLQLQMAGYDNASIVIADGHIDYAKPVAEQIVTTCSFGEHRATFDALSDTRKARFVLTASVTAKGKVACTFKGSFAVLLRD